MFLLRMTGSALAIIGLHLALTVAIFSFVFMHLFASPQRTKDALEEADIYSALLIEIENQIEEQASEFTITESDNGTEDFVRNSLDEAKLQQEVESALDATHAWLRGEENQLDFELDFSEARVAAAENLGDALADHLGALPTCTSIAQLPTTSDITQLSCLPPGLNITTERDRFVASLVQSEEFLPEAIISSSELLAQTDSEKYQQAPVWFQRIDQLLIPSLIAVVLFSLTIVALARDKRKGIRRTAAQLILFGGSLIFGMLAVWILLLARQTTATLNTPQEALAAAFNGLLVNGITLSVVIAAGILILGLVTRFIVRKPGK